MGWLVGLPLGLFRLLGGGVLLAVRIFWPVLWGWQQRALVRRMRRPAEKTARKERPPREPHFDGPVYTVEYQEVCQQPLSQEPDGPEPFGYKTGWLAIRCQDPRRVLEALGGTDVRPANWKTGLAAAEGPGGKAFVSLRWTAGCWPWGFWSWERTGRCWNGWQRNLKRCSSLPPTG